MSDRSNNFLRALGLAAETLSDTEDAKDLSSGEKYHKLDFGMVYYYDSPCHQALNSTQSICGKSGIQETERNIRGWSGHRRRRGSKKEGLPSTFLRPRQNANSAVNLILGVSTCTTSNQTKRKPKFHTLCNGGHSKGSRRRFGNVSCFALIATASSTIKSKDGSTPSPRPTFDDSGEGVQVPVLVRTEISGLTLTVNQERSSSAGHCSKAPSRPATPELCYRQRATNFHGSVLVLTGLLPTIGYVIVVAPLRWVLPGLPPARRRRGIRLFPRSVPALPPALVSEEYPWSLNEPDGCCPTTCTKPRPLPRIPAL